MANKFRHYYGCNATDITGGEATIYCDPALTKQGLQHRMPDGRNQHLEYLVEHCAGIGLAPSIITHGQNLTESMVKVIEDRGLDTWEISFHGLGELDGKKLGDGHKRLVRVGSRKGTGPKEVEGGFQKMMDGARHCTRPLRCNATVVEQTYRELPALAIFLLEHFCPGANGVMKVFNMIQFMPYHTHATKDADFQVKYTDAAPFIAEAVEIMEASGVEVNVRYFPPCIGHNYGFGRNCLMHYQIQRDPWEWAYESTVHAVLPIAWSAVRDGSASEQDFWDQAARLRTKICDQHARHRHPYSPVCGECAARKVCEGPDRQYAKRWDVSSELIPFTAEMLGMPNDGVTYDPNVFLNLSPGKSVEVEA